MQRRCQVAFTQLSPGSNASPRVVAAATATTPAWSKIAHDAAHRLWGASVTKTGSGYRNTPLAADFNSGKDAAGTHTSKRVNSTKTWFASYGQHRDPHTLALGGYAFGSATAAGIVAARHYVVNSCRCRDARSLVCAAVTAVTHGALVFKVFERYAIWQSQGGWFITWTASIPVTTGSRGSRSAVVSTRSAHLRAAALLVAYDVYARGVTAAPRGFAR